MMGVLITQAYRTCGSNESRVRVAQPMNSNKPTVMNQLASTLPISERMFDAFGTLPGNISEKTTRDKIRCGPCNASPNMSEHTTRVAMVMIGARAACSSSADGGLRRRGRCELV